MTETGGICDVSISTDSKNLRKRSPRFQIQSYGGSGSDGRRRNHGSGWIYRKSHCAVGASTGKYEAVDCGTEKNASVVLVWNRQYEMSMFVWQNRS